MWLEEPQGARINVERTNEVLATGADVVSTACPFCLIMLDDAVRARSRVENATVLDVAELLERSMEVPGGR
jgi:Fe-S oxidoreductase